MGLREASTTFTTLHTSSGFESGCREPNDIEIGIGIGGKNMGQLFPSWVAVRFNSLHSRTLEGVLVKSKITKADFPLRPWHTFYDWNFFVRVDRQFRYLLNQLTRTHHSKNMFGENIPADLVQDIIECERDTAFLPLWAIPQVGSRVSLTGRWIFDCGHPENGQHRLEIHPPKAVVSFRSEAAVLQGNSRPTRANQAVVFIGGKGGYIDLPINDQNYAFDLYLPPKPHPSAVPAFSVRGVTGMENEVSATLPVQPVFTPVPIDDPRLLRVVIPLAGRVPEPEMYGAIVSGGWTDPAGTEAAKVKRVRVVLRRVKKLGPGAPVDEISRRAWLFYFGVNGRWHRLDLNEPEAQLGVSTTLDLHENDTVHLTACGFAKLQIHQFMGEELRRGPANHERAAPHRRGGRCCQKVRAAFFDLDDIPEASTISASTSSCWHPPATAQFARANSNAHFGPIEEKLRENNYEMDYSIEVIS